MTQGSVASLLAVLLGGCVSPVADGAAQRDPRDPAGPDTAGTSDTSGVEPASNTGTYAARAVETLVASGSMRTSALTWDGAAGNFVGAWGSVPGGWHIDAATLDLDGETLTVSPVVRVDDGAYDGFEPDLAADGVGAVLVVYEDDAIGRGEGYREVFGRMLASGTLEPLGAGFSISQQPAVEEYTPAVASDSGSWFVAWADDREYSGDDARRLYGRAVHRDGSMGAVRRIGPAGSYWQTAPSVAGSDGEGHFLVVWGDYDLVDGALDAGYRACVVDTDGAPVSDVITLVRYGDQLFDRPAVAWNPWRRAWLVAWTQPYTLRSSIVAFDGTLTEGPILVDQEAGSGAPRLAWSSATNSYALAGHDWWDTAGFLQELDTWGAPVGDTQALTAPPPLGTFWQPVAASDDGTVLVLPSLDYNRIVATAFVGG